MSALSIVAGTATPSAMANRIKQMMKLRGMTREGLAEAVEAHPVTISKLIAGKMKLTQEWMSKLSQALDVRPEELLPSDGDWRTVRVKHSVQAGVWTDAYTWEEDDHYDVIVPADGLFEGEKLYGAEVRGPSMNRRYGERTVLIYTDAIHTRESLEPGKRYIVERRRYDEVEATVKLLYRDEAGDYWLLPESTDPRFQEPIQLSERDGEEVRIIGRVRYAVMRE